MEGRFEAHVISTTTMITLPPNRMRQSWFDISPKVSGNHVPLQLSIGYLDKTNNAHHLERTFQVAVVSKNDVTTNASAHDNLAFAALVLPDGRNQAILHQQLITSFDSEELNEVIFYLGWHPDDFKAELSHKAMKVIIRAVQHNQMDKLIAECQQRRKRVNW